MTKLNGKAQPVVISPVTANNLKVGVSQRVVAGNLSIPHRQMRFKEFRPLCRGQQFMRWNGALLIPGEVCSRPLFAGSFFKVPI